MDGREKIDDPKWSTQTLVVPSKRDSSIGCYDKRVSFPTVYFYSSDVKMGKSNQTCYTLGRHWEIVTITSVLVNFLSRYLITVDANGVQFQSYTYSTRSILKHKNIKGKTAQGANPER
jgi:hypothetical protein